MSEFEDAYLANICVEKCNEIVDLEPLIQLHTSSLDKFLEELEYGLDKQVPNQMQVPMYSEIDGLDDNKSCQGNFDMSIIEDEIGTIENEMEYDEDASSSLEGDIIKGKSAYYLIKDCEMCSGDLIEHNQNNSDFEQICQKKHESDDKASGFSRTVFQSNYTEGVIDENGLTNQIENYEISERNFITEDQSKSDEPSLYEIEKSLERKVSYDHIKKAEENEALLMCSQVIGEMLISNENLNILCPDNHKMQDFSPKIISKPVEINESVNITCSFTVESELQTGSQKEVCNEPNSRIHCQECKSSDISPRNELHHVTDETELTGTINKTNIPVEDKIERNDYSDRVLRDIDKQNNRLCQQSDVSPSNKEEVTELSLNENDLHLNTDDHLSLEDNHNFKNTAIQPIVGNITKTAIGEMELKNGLKDINFNITTNPTDATVEYNEIYLNPEVQLFIENNIAEKNPDFRKTGECLEVDEESITKKSSDAYISKFINTQNFNSLLPNEEWIGKDITYKTNPKVKEICFNPNFQIFNVRKNPKENETESCSENLSLDTPPLIVEAATEEISNSVELENTKSSVIFVDSVSSEKSILLPLGCDIQILNEGNNTQRGVGVIQMDENIFINTAVPSNKESCTGKVLINVETEFENNHPKFQGIIAENKADVLIDNEDKAIYKFLNSPIQLSNEKNISNSKSFNNDNSIVQSPSNTNLGNVDKCLVPEFLLDQKFIAKTTKIDQNEENIKEVLSRERLDFNISMNNNGHHSDVTANNIEKKNNNSMDHDGQCLNVNEKCLDSYVEISNKDNNDNTLNEGGKYSTDNISISITKDIIDRAPGMDTDSSVKVGNENEAVELKNTHKSIMKTLMVVLERLNGESSNNIYFPMIKSPDYHVSKNSKSNCTYVLRNYVTTKKLKYQQGNGSKHVEVKNETKDMHLHPMVDSNISIIGQPDIAKTDLGKKKTKINRKVLRKNVKQINMVKGPVQPKKTYCEMTKSLNISKYTEKNLNAVKLEAKVSKQRCRKVENINCGENKSKKKKSKIVTAQFSCDSCRVTQPGNCPKKVKLRNFQVILEDIACNKTICHVEAKQCGKNIKLNEKPSCEQIIDNAICRPVGNYEKVHSLKLSTRNKACQKKSDDIQINQAYKEHKNVNNSIGSYAIEKERRKKIPLRGTHQGGQSKNNYSFSMRPKYNRKCQMLSACGIYGSTKSKQDKNYLKPLDTDNSKRAAVNNSLSKSKSHCCNRRKNTKLQSIQLTKTSRNLRKSDQYILWNKQCQHINDSKSTFLAEDAKPQKETYMQGKTEDISKLEKKCRRINVNDGLDTVSIWEYQPSKQSTNQSFLEYLKVDKNSNNQTFPNQCYVGLRKIIPNQVSHAKSKFEDKNLQKNKTRKRKLQVDGISISKGNLKNLTLQKVTVKKSNVRCKKEKGMNEFMNSDQYIPQNYEAFYCPICPKTYKHKSNLLAHKKVHVPSEFVCNICDAQFKLKQQLKNHEKQKHSDARPFVCYKCTKRFKLKQQLQHHQLSHEDHRPFPCDQCEKSFKMKQQLQTHYTTHFNMKPFGCSVCGKCFRLKQQLNIHSRVHDKLKPFQCQQCEKTFSLRQNLKVHMLKHTDFRPFQCEECGKGFITKQNLMVHWKVHNKL